VSAASACRLLGELSSGSRRGLHLERSIGK
jgi:hypothetical protein